MVYNGDYAGGSQRSYSANTALVERVCGWIGTKAGEPRKVDIWHLEMVITYGFHPASSQNSN
jgi:hypothetical protein